jgi:hypothetical protein
MNSAGWCGVCLKEAKPYSYGYCPFDGNPPKEKEFVTRVKRAKHWGFCSDLCIIESQIHQLKETQLTILPIEDCARFNSSILGYSSDVELCAGKKTPYPKMKVYTRKKLQRRSSSGKKYVFIFKEDKINTVMYISIEI